MPTQPPKFNPNMPPQMQAKLGVQAPPMQPQQSQVPVEGGDDSADIIQGLEEHLSNINPQQKKFLVDALTQAPELVIPVLGIVNGQEVMDYFTQIYESYLKPNSAQGQPQAAPQPNQEPQQAPVPQPQAKATFNPQG